MIAIDTNILVRIFIDDLSTSQIKAARQLVKNAKDIFLPLLVIIEMVWVLLRAYKLTKEQVLLVLQEIHDNEAFHVEQRDHFTSALRLYKKYNIDFSDCMILVSTEIEKVTPLYSFDVKFGKMPGVKILK